MTWRDVLWRESWVNLIMQMRDMPYYHHFSGKERKGGRQETWHEDGEPHITFKGDEEVLKRKFGKYIKKQKNGSAT
jgi:hypothetical protein